jgi:hypothetical protein
MPAYAARSDNMAFASTDNPLAELMKTFGCADVIAPVDAEAFGERTGELLTHIAFGKGAEWITRLVREEQHVLRHVLKIDRVRRGGPPRVRMPSTTAPITLKRKAAR